MNITKVKFLREIEAERKDIEDPDERGMSLTVCECMHCHWTFIGDCERTGHGFTCEGTQVPNYCPMCGSKFDDDLLEDTQEGASSDGIS